MTAELSLLADVGGTNTRVALAAGGVIDRASVRRFANADHAGLGAVLARFLDEAGRPACAAACIAVAGPVEDGIARLTNRDWIIDPAELARATGIGRVGVLNDLQAQGHALDRLNPSDLDQVIGVRASRARTGARLVVGVGTGFNSTAVIAGPGGSVVTASETGHTSLPLRTDDDVRLARHIEAAHHGFAGVEDVLSGRGLERLYAWHAAEAGRADRAPAQAIMAAMDSGGDALVEATGRHFVRLLGAVAGDLALSYLPFSGLFLIGGVARAFGPHLGRFGFAEAFADKGRFGPFMDQFPVFLVEDDYAALAGCAAYLATA